jgi:tRNA-specific 2-thiouridylase
MMNNTVVIGMSGGVDSAVAAYLLKEQGYNVVALFMHNWEETDGGVCTAEADFEDVKAVSNKLNIPYYSINFAKDYLDRVFSYFLSEYQQGRTPNPDVLCNREIKFGPFLDYAKKLGAQYIATGHYCGIRHDGDRHFLLKAADEGKDQTYFLNQLSQPQLSNVLFPLADIDKATVREIAEKCGFVNARKKDSTGICFIGERNFREFLSTYLPSQEGDIVDTAGNVVGKHMGLMYYTLGQRRGLGLGGTLDSQERWFVVEKHLDTNTLVVSHGDESVLNSSSLIANNINWIPAPPESFPFKCNAKFRYRQAEQGVTVHQLPGGGVRVVFDEKQRAVTPGQFVVFYKDDMCLGGGAIDEVTK